MKTIVSLALVGLMSISALLPALAAQEAESVSIHESSGISESMAQDESSVSSSGTLAEGNATSDSSSTADESSAPESGSNAEDGSDSVPQPESDSMTSDEMDADSEPASDSETAESDADAEAENSSDVMEAAVGEQTVPVTVSEEYALLLATNQADSMMGHAGMERSSACTQPAASFALADYAAETEDESYCLLWEAMNAEFEQLGAQGCTAANCVFTDGMIILMR